MNVSRRHMWKQPHIDKAVELRENRRCNKCVNVVMKFYEKEKTAEV